MFIKSVQIAQSFMLATFLSALLWVQTVQAAVVDQVSVGAGFASRLEKRGAISYDDFQVAPIVTAYFFDKKFEYLTDSLNYRQFLWGDKMRWRSGIHYISDDPLFPSRDHFQYVDRDSSFEWSNRLEIYIPNYGDYSGEIDLGVAKDLKEHFGHYFDLTFKLKIFEYRWDIISRDQSEFMLFTTFGYADKAHNKYFYGQGAKAGWTHFSAGLWVNFPERADRYTPILMVEYFEVLNSTNKQASLMTGNDHGWVVTLVGAVPVFEK